MPLQRKALGRGLSELLGTPDLEPNQLREIDIDRIVPNPSQPRKVFDSRALDDLAASIREHGIVQPVVVRALPDGLYELVAGERRWRAAQRADLLRMPAIVRDAQDQQRLEIALVENIQREGLNPMDEARAYQRLMTEFGLTQDDVALRVGKSRASVANMVRLLKLPGEVQEWLLEGRLSAGHAKALLSLTDPDEIVSSAREMIRGKISVRQAEALTQRAAQRPKGRALTDPNVRAAVMELERALGTRVTLRERKGKGRIEIHFHSQEELERLYGGLLAAQFQ